uniref:Uncharacterized protein n=1 Tax=Meloidogyne incognita TaxID=6306 RepID=A0A914MQ20_MELIC
MIGFSSSRRIEPYQGFLDLTILKEVIASAVGWAAVGWPAPIKEEERRKFNKF